MRRMCKVFLIVIAMAMLSCLGGCATVGIGGPPTLDQLKAMTHLDRATLAMEVYSDEWDRHQALYEIYKEVYPNGFPENVTEDLEARKKVLEKAEPVIKRYYKFAKAGGVVQPEDVQEVLEFLRIYYLKKQGGK